MMASTGGHDRCIQRSYFTIFCRHIQWATRNLHTFFMGVMGFFRNLSCTSGLFVVFYYGWFNQQSSINQRCPSARRRTWRSGRCTQVVQGTALEMRQTGWPVRGFESHHLRHKKTPAKSLSQVFLCFLVMRLWSHDIYRFRKFCLFFWIYLVKWSQNGTIAPVKQYKMP